MVIVIIMLMIIVIIFVIIIVVVATVVVVVAVVVIIVTITIFAIVVLITTYFHQHQHDCLCTIITITASIFIRWVASCGPKENVVWCSLDMWGKDPKPSEQHGQPSLATSTRRVPLSNLRTTKYCRSSCHPRSALQWIIPKSWVLFPKVWDNHGIYRIPVGEAVTIGSPIATMGIFQPSSYKHLGPKSRLDVGTGAISLAGLCSLVGAGCHRFGWKNNWLQLHEWVIF